jgi:hypothetical protein
VGQHEAAAADRHSDWRSDGGPVGTWRAERPVGLDGAQVCARGGDLAGGPWASPIRVHVEVGQAQLILSFVQFFSNKFQCSKFKNTNHNLTLLQKFPNLSS